MGSTTIKGITVALGGDTTKLVKSFKDLDTRSRGLQTELNKINKQLKFNPDSTSLLAMKQEVLAEKVEVTRETLKKLKDMQGEVERAAKNGTLGEDKYREYKLEVEKTENVLKNLEKQLSETGDKFSEVQRKSGAVTFKNAEDKVEHFKGKVKDMTDAALDNAEKLSKGFDKVGDGLEKVGGVVNKGSAAAAAVLAGSVAAFKDLDEGYDVIVKKTGAVDSKFDGLKQTADELFGNSVFDMTDIGNAIGEVNTRFGYTDEVLKSVTEQYLQFAKINDADVSDSVAKTARIMQAWDISSENLPDLLGMITAKGQETGIAVGSLMDKVLDNNATFKEMGLSLEESINLMAQFEKNGINDSTALAAMKASVKNAAKEGLNLSEVLGGTIEKIKNAATDTEALQIATELFGSKGAAEMVNAIKEGRISFDDLSGSMSSYKDTVKKTYDATLDPLEESKQVLNNLKLAGADLAATALKEGKPLIDDVVKGIKGITDWFKKLSPEQKKVLTKAIEITAVVGPGVTILGKLTKGVGSFVGTGAKMVKSLQNTTVAQMGLNAAMDANPVGAVTLAITAFVAVLGGAITAINAFHDAQLENAGFKQQLDDMQETVDKISEIRDGINNTVSELKNASLSAGAEMGVIDDYRQRLDELLEKSNLTPAEQAELTTIGDYFAKKYPEFEKTWNDYITVDDNGIVEITGNVEELKEKLDSLISKYKQVAAQAALSNLAQQNAEAVVNSQQQVRDAAAEMLKASEALEEFQKEWDLTDENLASLASAQPWFEWENADKSVKLFASDVLNQYNALVEKGAETTKSYEEVVEGAAQLKQNGDELARMQAVVNGNYEDAAAVMMAYNEGLISTIEVEQSKWKSLDNLKTKAKETATETGSNLVYGLKNGIDKYKSEISDSGIEQARLYLDSFDATMGIESPSKEMYKRGQQTVQGFVNGIRDSLSGLWDTAVDIGSTALNAIKSFLGIQSPSKEAAKLGAYLGEGFSLGIKREQKNVLESALKLSDTARNGLKDIDISPALSMISAVKSSRLRDGLTRTVNNSTTTTNAPVINVRVSGVTINNDSDIDALTDRIANQLGEKIIQDGRRWG